MSFNKAFTAGVSWYFHFSRNYPAWHYMQYHSSIYFNLGLCKTPLFLVGWLSEQLANCNCVIIVMIEINNN